MSEKGEIDLCYAGESKVALEPCVPYGWQFPGEEVFMPTRRGGGINCFAILKRNNECQVKLCEGTINSQFIFEQLEELSLGLKKLTVVVLDNARVNSSKIIKERLAVWQRRGLYIFYLPRYSPHLNIVEILWRKLKYEWLSPADYDDPENLYYQVRLALTAVGTSLFIKFSSFNNSLM